MTDVAPQAIGDHLGMLSIAACNYIFREIANFDEFADHVAEVLDAADAADVIVLPELFTVELMTTIQGWQEADVSVLAETARFAEQLESFFESTARGRQKHIVFGSHLRAANGGNLNISQLCGPDGLITEHAKTHLFPVEFSLGTIEGDQMQAFDLVGTRAGINICYEAEIPECSASLAEQGAELILTPSLTFAEAGFWRVRHCVQARCIENQVFSVHACAGGIPRGPFPGGFARSSICGPSDDPWPPNGVLAEAESNADSVAIAELDFDALATNRASGAATTFTDRRRRSDRYRTWPSHLTSTKG